MASLLLIRDNCRCAKGRERKHKVWRIRCCTGRNSRGRQQWARSHTVHGSRRMAEQRAAEIDAAARSGQMLAPAHMTVSQFLDRWYADEVVQTLAPRTQADYRRQIELHVTPVLGSYRLRDLMTHHVIDLRNRVLNRPGRRTGRRPIREAAYAVQVIRSALTFAKNTGLVPVNVACGVTLPKGSPEPRPAYDRTVIRRLVSALRTSEIGSMVEFMARTGVRRSEAAGLGWSDVDLAARQVYIRQSLQRIGRRGVVFGTVKTHRSARPVRLDATLADRLARHRDHQAEERQRLGDAYQDHGLVFPWPDGRPRDPDNVARKFRRLVDALGLPPLALKDLRHAFATLNLADGAPLAEVQAQLGHASPTTTLNFYVDHLPSQQTAMVDRFGASLDLIEGHEVDDLLTDETGRDRRHTA